MRIINFQWSNKNPTFLFHFPMIRYRRDRWQHDAVNHQVFAAIASILDQLVNFSIYTLDAFEPLRTVDPSAFLSTTKQIKTNCQSDNR